MPVKYLLTAYVLTTLAFVGIMRLSQRTLRTHVRIEGTQLENRETGKNKMDRWMFRLNLSCYGYYIWPHKQTGQCPLKDPKEEWATLYGFTWRRADGNNRLQPK